MSRELLQQALDALESADAGLCELLISHPMRKQNDKAITALRAALAQPEAEPVAYAQNPKDDFWCWCNADEQGAIPLYAAPQAQPTPAVPDGVPDTSLVICPNCCTQFRAIPQDVQRLMIDAGFEPPFVAPPVVREQLTNGEIYTAYIAATNQTLRPQDERLALAFARAIEKAHGIAAPGSADHG